VKNILIYAIIFLLAFSGTSAVIYMMNSKYVNMFGFDFRETAVFEAAIADSLSALQADSLSATDSLIVLKNIKTNEKELLADLNSANSELNKVELELGKKNKEIERLKSKLEIKHKAEHEQWLKSTVKLYEAMESNKAAEILSKISENEAREIIYSMKKKKAADILSELSAETIKRLTRAD